MTRRREAIALLSALASACTISGPPAPVIEAISPAETHANTATDVSVRGRGFAPEIQADLEDPESSTPRAAFALTLLLADERIPLENVAFVSEHELSARVPPLATPAVYDLELVDPRGRVAMLPAAFTVDPGSGCGPDGTPCDDGNVCTQGDTCQGGTCVPGFPVCVNTAPRACLSVSPVAVAVGEAVTFDPSCSTDGEDPTSALRARVDFGDGVSEASFAPAVSPRQHAYATPGLWVANVEVVDRGGISDFASRYVLVTAPGDLVLVTTALDEADPGATPDAPGGTGLSLREAIAYVNALGAPRTIRVAVAGPIVHATALPALAVAASAIVGDPAGQLAFPGVALPCLTLGGPDQLLLDAVVTGCSDTAVMLGTASAGARVAECTITPSPGAHGITAQASGAIGPRDQVSGAGTGVMLTGSPGSAFVVEENRIQENDVGIFAVGGAQLTIRRNRVTSNRTFGLQTTPSGGSATLLHNVFDANGRDGVDLGTFLGGVVVRNNLFTRNGGFGLQGSGTTVDHNGFFGNGLGPMSSGSGGPTDLLGDPLYGGDHRLSPGSPAIDRGIDTGLDVNGPAAGNFFGAAPDLGAWEAPYPAP
ncbi:MAG TPA: right-handed parallel beta-helix repeat-containing protein [Anaeromyxobacter sp.]